MKRSTGLATIAAAAALATTAAAFAPLPAAAQPAQAGLTYAQPLSPEALMRVQEKLRQLGAYQGRVDGVWGPDSQAALERFQQGRGLQVTGQLNQATVATLGMRPGELLEASRSGGGSGTAAGADAGPAAAMSGPLSQDAVRNIQARLRSLGFYRARPDGVWGPGTQASLERFQQGRGLQSTGQINPATAQALGLDPNNLGAPVR
jgi:peptidoglycan hydrolase-like protein with peptidoglycan-binding domain